MPTKQPRLAKLTRPRLHITVARGLVSDVVARLREAGQATALLLTLIPPQRHKAVARGLVSDAVARLRGGCDTLAERPFAGAAA